MSHDESLELPRLQKTESISFESEGWRTWFVGYISQAYQRLAERLPPDATLSDFQKAMMTAVGDAFDVSRTAPDNVPQVCEEIEARLLPEDEGTPWDREKNARRLNLIDKKIQQTITPGEAIELTRLTRQMRLHCDREEMVPLEGARELHRRLLDMGDPKETSR
jgi:hypothetical protein